MEMGIPVKAGDVVPAWVGEQGYRVALLAINDDRRVMRADFLEAGDAVPAESAGALPQACTRAAGLFDPVPDNLFIEQPDEHGDCMLVYRHDLTHGAA